MYQLKSHTQRHTKDIKSICLTTDEKVVSVSRDGKCKVGDEVLIDSDTFLNSVCSSQDSVFVGANDGLITQINLKTKQQTFYFNHTSNVSSLDFNFNKLVSGSWDKTIIVWQSPTQSIVLKGHEHFVWGVKFVTDNLILSCSADKTIKLWDLNQQKCIKTFQGHTHAVRSIAVLNNNEFVSCGNDNLLILWELNSSKKTVFSGHSSFVYSLSCLNNFVLSGGEDRTVRLFSNTKLQQTLTLPSQSQWCVLFKPNKDIVVGSSDGTITEFTLDKQSMASAIEQAEFDNLVNSCQINEEEIDVSQIKTKEYLQNKGTEGEICVVDLHAFRFYKNEWVDLGPIKRKEKPKFEGVEYDYVFDVDVAEGQPPLKLPFNNTDNVYTAAEKFVAKHNLPEQYEAEVVQFLLKNSNAKATVTERKALQKVHYNQLHFIKTFNKDALLKALNNPTVTALVNDLPKSANELLETVLQIQTSDLKASLPVFDLLRVAIAEASEVNFEKVFSMLLTALDMSVPKHFMLSVRGVANLVARLDFDAGNAVCQQMLLTSLELISEIAPHLNGKALAQALATLALNLSVLQISYLDYENMVNSFWSVVALDGDDEALYRMALATSLSGVKGKPEWFKRGKEERFRKLVA